MKVAPLLAIAPGGILTANSAAESDYAAWAVGTNYALGDQVTKNHRDWKSLQAANVGHDPETSPAWWQDRGVSNAYKMFDAESNSATVAASPLTVVLTPAQRITALGLFGMTAGAVQVSGTSAGVPVYGPRNISLLNRKSRTWSEYYWGGFWYRRSLVLGDLPPYTNLVLTVTLTRAVGNVSCETMAIGRGVDIGKVKLGAESDVLGFSKIIRDEFGGATLQPGTNVPLNNLDLVMSKATVDKARRMRDLLGGKPGMWWGFDDYTDGYFESLAMLGIYKRMPIIVQYAKEALCRLELEGL
jgi:hypothetical protein